MLFPSTKCTKESLDKTFQPGIILEESTLPVKEGKPSHLQ